MRDMKTIAVVAYHLCGEAGTKGALEDLLPPRHAPMAVK
jgi:hypothetical protein